MKKHLVLILSVVVIAIMMVACGGKTDETKPVEESQTEQAMPAEETPAVEETMPAEEAAPVEETTEAPTPTGEEKAKTEAPTTKSTSGALVGQIVSFDDVVKGGNGKVTSAQAEALMAKGSLLLFRSSGKLYFVYSTSGAYADNAEVSITGKIAKKSGLNVITMSDIK
jgi:hypothetical protein